MKRADIIIISVLLVIIATLFGLRHAIIGHAFKISINKKTNQAITFNIGNAHYCVINSSISFTNSEFLFKDTYLNKEKTIKLSEIKFDELKLEGLSLLHLIFRKELIASKFTISDPLLGFHENNTPIQFHKKPKEIIGSLKKHHDIFCDLTVIVDEIEITHGKIDIISMLLGKEQDGSVDFTLLLKDFNTSKEDMDEDRVFFAQNHFVKLSNFNYFFPNGDKISFDSIVLESNVNTLVTSNIRIDVASKSIHPKFDPIIAEIGELQVKGIDFEALEKLHDIVIDSIEISDVFFHLTQNEEEISNVATDTSTKRKNLLGPIRMLNVSSLLLNNINVLNEGLGGDTIASLENLNLLVNQIRLDSNSLANRTPDIDYSSINVSSGRLEFVEKESDFKFSLENFDFNEKLKNISLVGLSANKSNIHDAEIFAAKVVSIEISGASVEAYVKKEQMNVELLISNPIVDLNLSNRNSQKSKKRNVKIDNLGISSVKISNGSIHLVEKGKLDLVVTGIDFNSGKLYLNDISKIHEINTDGISLVTNSVAIQMPDKNLLVNSSSSSILNNTFTINHISGKINDNAKINSTFLVNQLQIRAANIGRIISEKEINLDYVKILKPQVSGTFNLISERKEETHKPPAKKVNYKLNIGDVRVSNGKVDLNLNIKKESIIFNSGIDVYVENIKMADSKDTSWLEKLNWRLSLSQPVVSFQDYLFDCQAIVSDSKTELLSIEKVNILDNPDISINNGIEIKEIGIKNIRFSGLKYNTILEKQTPVIRSISIEKPFVDIRIDSRIKNPHDNSKSKQKKLTIPIDLGEFIISNLSLKAEKQDSISVSNFSLSNFDFKYSHSTSENIIDWLEYLRIEDFVYSDTIKNSFASVEKLNINKQHQKIGLVNIRGGSINKLSYGDNYLAYVSSGIEFSDVNISKTIPLNININGIDINDFQLDIEDHKTGKTNIANSTTGNSAKKKIKLPGSIKSFGIDHFDAKKININHVTISDSTTRKLKLTNLGLLIDSFKVDSTIISEGDFQFAEQITVSLKGNKFVSSDSLYATSLNTINYNFPENDLSIDSLSMMPRYKPAEFFKKAVYQTGRMELVTDKINCGDIRLKKFISDGSIHIGGIDVFGLDMRIFRNKKYEMNPNLYKKMPNEALLDVSRILTIDSLRTHQAFIEYKQLSKKSLVPGEIFLNNIYLSAFNINNDLKVIDQTSSMVVFFNAKLLGTSNLDLKLTLPILSPSYDFWVTGHLDKVDLTKVNSMTQNLVGITMKSGTGELDIPLISGNSIHSDGSILFKYKKLKIELYNRDHAENATGLGGSMANLLLNDIFIRSNNPGLNGKMKSGEVYFERNTQKSIVYYTWKSILSGLMSTMGYNNKEQRHEKRALKHKGK